MALDGIDLTWRLKLMVSVIEDYRKGVISLDDLSYGIGSIMHSLGCKALEEEMFEHYCGIETANALAIEEEGFDFEKRGRRVVDEAVAGIPGVIQRHLR